MWRRRAFSLFQSPLTKLYSSTTSEETPSLYSFLQPSLFSQKTQFPPSSSSSKTSSKTPNTPLTPEQKTNLETTLQNSLSSSDTDEAWKSFRSLTNNSFFPKMKYSGLTLDASSYDSLIEASMSSQDFQSAFSIFREMRDARILDLKGSYLTIMTGLTENNRPELMAAFLDEVVEDPRIEIGTHDWNSIIHAFCKAGRLEDANRTFRRMVFLQFGPNAQTYLSLINGYVAAGKYFNVLMLWNEVKRRVSPEDSIGLKLDHSLVDAFLYAMVKGGYFDAVMEVVDCSRELKIFVDKWKYKQAFMETHKKLKVSKLRWKNFRKMEALIAFKNWAGLSI